MVSPGCVFLSCKDQFDYPTSPEAAAYQTDVGGLQLTETSMPERMASGKQR